MEPEQSTDANDFADFWAPDPPRPHWSAIAALRRAVHCALRRRGPAATLAVALLAAFTVAPSSSPAAAAMPPMEPDESLSSLRERAEELSGEYNGELRDMEGVIKDAEKAEKRAEKTQGKVDEAEEQVRRLAIASYTSGGVDPSLTLFVEEDPQDIIDQAQIVSHLSTTNQDKIEQLEQAISRDEKAQANADEKVAEVQEDLDELEGQREEVQELIADYPEQTMGGKYNLTPRTEQMRELIIEKFGENKKHGGVGCYRPVGGYVVGEHPKGRACDFMVDKNGQMPSQEQIDHGYAIAEWAQDNADRLGIMYIIYRQKIWDIRRGDEGWRDMADRGSITENHFDHVHISMF